jgi:hypothetical protein
MSGFIPVAEFTLRGLRMLMASATTPIASIGGYRRW